LDSKVRRIDTNYSYYNQDLLVRINADTHGADSVRLNSDLVRRTVDNYRNRLMPSYWKDAGTVAKYLTNNLYSKTIKSALIGGVGFIRIDKITKELKSAISQIQGINQNVNVSVSSNRDNVNNFTSSDVNDVDLLLSAYDGRDATGYINENGTLFEAYSVDSRDELGNVSVYSHYTTERTSQYDANNNLLYHWEHNLGYCPLLPIVLNPNAERPFGVPIIDEALRYKAVLETRTNVQRDKVQEFLSKGQNYLLGVSQTLFDKLQQDGQLETIFALTKDEDGQNPSAGVFNQVNPSTFSNPAPTELSAHQEYYTLRQYQADLQDCFKRVLVTCLSVLEGKAYNLLSFADMKLIFRPITDLNLSLFGDGIIKVNQAVPGYFGKAQLDEFLGENGGENPGLDVNQALVIANALTRRNAPETA
jgi:hypothetical protein